MQTVISPSATIWLTFTVSQQLWIQRSLLHTTTGPQRGFTLHQEEMQLNSKPPSAFRWRLCTCSNSCFTHGRDKAERTEEKKILRLLLQWNRWQAGNHCFYGSLNDGSNKSLIHMGAAPLMLRLKYSRWRECCSLARLSWQEDGSSFTSENQHDHILQWWHPPWNHGNF